MSKNKNKKLKKSPKFKNKSAKSKKPIRKPSAAKKAAPKKATVKKKPIVEKKRPAAVTLSPLTTPSTPPLPTPTIVVTRSPRRTIIGTTGPLQITEITPIQKAVTAIPSEEQREISTVTAVPVAQLLKFNEPLPPALDLPELEEYSWDNLPSQFPARMKFTIRAAEAECEKAADWPYPFAKFVFSLPKTICGLEFSFMLIGLEHDNKALGTLYGYQEAQVAASIEKANVKISENFINTCPEIARKFGTQIAHLGLSVERLIEPYLIPSIDKDLQIAIASILLSALGTQKPSIQQKQYALAG